MTPFYGLFWERCRDMSQQNFADRKASCERRVAFTLQNTFLKRCQVSGGGQDININITSVARKYFKQQSSHWILNGFASCENYHQSKSKPDHLFNNETFRQDHDLSLNHITYCLDIFYLLCTKPG